MAKKLTEKELTETDLILVGMCDAINYHWNEFAKWSKKRSQKAKRMREYHKDWTNRYQPIVAKYRDKAWKETFGG